MTDEPLPEPVDESLILTWLDAPLNFKSQASPIAPAFRTQRRVPLCLLLVQKSWGERATWKALHVMNWAIQSERRLSLVVGYRAARDLPDRPIKIIDRPDEIFGDDLVGVVRTMHLRAAINKVRAAKKTTTDPKGVDDLYNLLITPA